VLVSIKGTKMGRHNLTVGGKRWIIFLIRKKPRQRPGLGWDLWSRGYP
jgi:hypothetical protein